MEMKRLKNLAGLLTRKRPPVGTTPADVVHAENKWKLLRYRRSTPAKFRTPVLFVPSLINRHYVLDLLPGKSFAEWLVAEGHDVYCIDWGTPGAEDKFLTFDEVADGYIARAIRKACTTAGAPKAHVLGYCMGGTLAAIAAALAPSKVAGLVNLAGPIDFAQAGDLRHMVSPEWFDAEAIAGAGNITARQMQDGFAMLRPTLALSKWVGYLDRMHDPKQRLAFAALEAWSSDNVDFPAAAYVTYIEELYQQNLLPRGEHHVAGKRVDLGRITCPVMSAVASHDTICPPAAAYALNDLSGSTDKTILTVTGGHVGAVVGSRAARELYPPMVAWWKKHLATRPAAQETVLHN
jgi:polyhydroxyalkanoate synthase